jgi:hypothetical protein
VIVVPRSLGGDGTETGDLRSRSSKNLVPFRPREHGDDGGEKQCGDKQDPHANCVFSTGIHETRGGAVKQVDWDDEKEEDHERDDGHDEALDSKVAIEDFDTFRFLSALLN